MSLTEPKVTKFSAVLIIEQHGFHSKEFHHGFFSELDWFDEIVCETPEFVLEAFFEFAKCESFTKKFWILVIVVGKIAL